MAQQKKREIELMEIMWHLTLDMGKKILEDDVCGDDVLSFLTSLAYEFNDEVYSEESGETYLQQLEEFEKWYTKEAVMSSIPKCDWWCENPWKIGNKFINHIYCDGTPDGSYIADEPNGAKDEFTSTSDEADIWFFDELNYLEIIDLSDVVPLDISDIAPLK